MEGPRAYPLMSLKPVSSKKWNFVFLETHRQLVSKEWEIVNLEVIPDHNPEPYKMEPRTSTRWGQIATNIPLKNAFGQRWDTHKIQIARKWRGPGPPFPRGNSKGDNTYMFVASSKFSFSPKKYIPIIHSSPTLLILAGRNSTAVKLLLGSFNFSTISKAAPIKEGLDAKRSGQFCIV